MRLIDADKLLMLINEQKEKETGSYSKGRNEGLNIAKSIINDETQMPTAYDVDKVVEQLEATRDVLDEEMTQTYIWNRAISEAIEIVKAGGIEW